MIAHLYQNVVLKNPKAIFAILIIAILSFGAIMMATRLDKVGEAAVLRETSTIFAAIIGYIFLKETVGIVRFLMIALIAIGAVIVELGS